MAASIPAHRDRLGPHIFHDALNGFSVRFIQRFAERGKRPMIEVDDPMGEADTRFDTGAVRNPGKVKLMDCGRHKIANAAASYVIPCRVNGWSISLGDLKAEALFKQAKAIPDSAG